ncbi:S8 family peptidase [bacterium]|nr:S8 family peptidase [bacterium]
MNRLQRFGVLALTLSFVILPAAFSAPRMPVYENNLSVHLLNASDDELVPVFIGIENPYPLDDLLAEVQEMPLPQRREHAITTLQSHFNQSASATESWLRTEEQAGRARNLYPLWISHGFAVHLQADRIDQLAELDEVSRIRYQPPLPFESVNDEMPDPDLPEPSPDELDEISWAIPYIGADDLWTLGYTGESVIVALIDSGVDPHDDLIDHQWINEDEVDGNGIDDDHNGYIDDIHGWNFYHNTPDISDAQGHGTKCTGIVCGDGTLGTQTGIAPDARWIMIRNYADGWVSEGTRAAAVQYAVTNGATVISSSMSYKYNAPSYIPDYATHRYTYWALLAVGVISANSVGNDGSGGPYPPWNIASPGNCPPPFLHPEQYVEGGGISGVMGIGAHDSNGNAKYYSGDGPAAWEEPEYPLVFQDYPWADGALPGLKKPDILAPTEIPTTDDYPVNNYTNFTGSSASTPVVGGAMVLLRDIHPQAPPEAIAEAIMMTADDGGDPGFDNKYGAGRLRVDLAHDYLDNMYDYGSLQVVIDGAATLDSFTVTVGNGEINRKAVGTDTLLVERVLPGTYDVTLELPNSEWHYYSDIEVTGGETNELPVYLDLDPFNVSPNHVALTADLPQLMYLKFDVNNPDPMPITVDVAAVPPGGIDWTVDVEAAVPADSVRSVVATGDGILIGGYLFTQPRLWMHEYDVGGFTNFMQPTRFGYTGMHDGAWQQDATIGALFEDKIFLLDGDATPEYSIIDSLALPDVIREPAGLACHIDNWYVADNETHILYRLDATGTVTTTYDLRGMKVRTLSYRVYDDPQSDRVQILFEDPAGNAMFSTIDINTGELDIPYPLYPEIGYEPLAMSYETFRAGIQQGVVLLAEDGIFREYWRGLNVEPVTGFAPTEFPTGLTEMRVDLPMDDLTPYISHRFDLVFQTHEGGHRDTSAVTVYRDYLSVEDEHGSIAVPTRTSFEKAYPNPFNSTVTLQYALPSPGEVRLAVYDVLGREVAVLDNNRRAAGRHQVVWTTGNQATGIYFAVLEAGDARQTKKLLLMK